MLPKSCCKCCSRAVDRVDDDETHTSCIEPAFGCIHNGDKVRARAVSANRKSPTRNVSNILDRAGSVDMNAPDEW